MYPCQTEIDLLHERAGLTRFYEIKTAHNYRPRLLEKMEKVAYRWDRQTDTNLIYTGDEEHRMRKSRLVNWRNVEWEQ